MRWHGNSESWGSEWKENDIVGCAVELSKDGKLARFSFSLNGSFEAPMGVAYDNVPVESALRPAITFNKVG